MNWKKPITIQELTRECLKQMDAGNGNKIVMIKNDRRFGEYNPVFSMFEDNAEEITKKMKTANPNLYVTLG